VKELIDYLKSIYKEAEVFPSVEKDYIIVREQCGSYRGPIGDVPFYRQTKIHVDTVRLRILQNKISSL
jgi:hypothetical protein